MLQRGNPPSCALVFKVRDHELDQYGVVNNAVYLNYLEHTRHSFLYGIGLDAAFVAAQGRSLALSEVRCRYLAPLCSRQLFCSLLWVDTLSGARVVFEQRLMPIQANAESTFKSQGSEDFEKVSTATVMALANMDKPLLQAWTTAVFLNEARRPMRIPEPWRSQFSACIV